MLQPTARSQVSDAQSYQHRRYRSECCASEGPRLCLRSQWPGQGARQEVPSRRQQSQVLPATSTERGLRSWSVQPYSKEYENSFPCYLLMRSPGRLKRDPGKTKRAAAIDPERMIDGGVAALRFAKTRGQYQAAPFLERCLPEARSQSLVVPGVVDRFAQLGLAGLLRFFDRTKPQPISTSFGSSVASNRRADPGYLGKITQRGSAFPNRSRSCGSSNSLRIRSCGEVLA